LFHVIIGIKKLDYQSKFKISDSDSILTIMR